MPVLPEDRILSYLERCINLQQSVIPLLEKNGTNKAKGQVLEGFKRFLLDLSNDKKNDSYLSDESWNWIWKGKPNYNYLQLYGRLAWINLQLFDLL